MEQPQENQIKPQTFKRARYKHFMRYIGLAIVLLLNLGLVYHTIERQTSHAPGLETPRQIALFAIVFFLSVSIVLPIIFEVDKLIVQPDSLEIYVPLWRSKVRFDDIQWLRAPYYLSFAILRTKRGFYLINRRDFAPFHKLLESLTGKVKYLGER